MTAPDDALAAIEARAAAATPARERIAQRFGENPAVIQHATDVVIASAADVPALLAALRTLAAQHAADVAAAVAGERARIAAECKRVVRENTRPWELAEEIADALAAPTGGGE